MKTSRVVLWSLAVVGASVLVGAATAYSAGTLNTLGLCRMVALLAAGMPVPPLIVVLNGGGKSVTVRTALLSLCFVIPGVVHALAFLRAQENRAKAAAAQRMNLPDGMYGFLRAIDGDTLEVNPPKGLIQWMENVRVRLYGMDTPEMHEPFGPAYADVTARVCGGSGDANIWVLWERDSDACRYPGYPKSSFERDVGHVFVETTESLVYLNGLLAALPQVKTVTRKGRDLIPGRKLLPALAWRGRCPVPLPEKVSSALSTHPQLRDGKLGIPGCVCLFSKEFLEAFDERVGPMRVLALLHENFARFSCPLWPRETSAFEAAVRCHGVSPFDLPLLVANEWSQWRWSGAEGRVSGD